MRKLRRLWDKFGLVLFWIFFLTAIVYVGLLIIDLFTTHTNTNERRF